MEFPRAPSSVRLSLTLVGWLAGGCHGAGAGGLPTWYLPGSGAYPSTQYAVGRGACGPEVAPAARASCAAQRAVEDAVLQLRAHVTAVHTQDCRLDTTQLSGGGAKRVEAESSCSSQMGGSAEATLDLSNTAPREQACDANNCYALVALSRAELAAHLVESHAAERANFEQLVERAVHTDILSSLSLLAQAAALAKPLDNTAALLQVFEPSAGLARSFAARVLEARRTRLLGASVCLRSAEDSQPRPERVFAQATALLSEQGIDQVQLGSSCARGTLTVDYLPASPDPPLVKRSEDANALWTIRYVGHLRVSTPDGALAREQEVLGHGLSRTPDAARRDAEDRLASAVREAIATLVLGLSV